ncbi:serine hydrolase [Elusimicrobiota bacterium]
MKRSLRVFPAALLFIVSWVPAARAAGEARYDVSYLWHKDVSAVQTYKKKVGYTLGPAVRKKLRVVKGPKHYGLIYYRRGSGAGAQKAARSHTRVLRSKGLEAAAPVRSKDWTFVSDDGKVTAPTVKEAAVAKKERDEEAHSLETMLEAYVKRLRGNGRLASDERTAWSVYDFTTGEKLVTINEDMKLQGASLVKPFFALAFFHKVKEGELKYGGKSRRNMERMIQRSNNWSTNWVIRQVGGPRSVQRILKKHYPHIFEDTNIVEYIPAGGRTYRNTASVHDYSRFLYALHKGHLPRSSEIKRVMSLPNRDRIYTGAKDVPAGTKVYNKTGSTAQICGDMGILIIKGKDGTRYPYTLIGVIEKRRPARNYLSWIRSRGNVIRQVSNMVYRAISNKHKLKD